MEARGKVGAEVGWCGLQCSSGGMCGTGIWATRGRCALHWHPRGVLAPHRTGITSLSLCRPIMHRNVRYNCRVIFLNR